MTINPTSTIAPTATVTVTPTAIPVVLHLRLVVKASLQAQHTGSIRVAVTGRRAAAGPGKSQSLLSGAVPGASVTVDGRQVGMHRLLHGKTDRSGAATFKNIRPMEAGSITVSVTKTGFVGATRMVRVRP